MKFFTLIICSIFSSIIGFSQQKWALNDALNFGFYQNGFVKTKTFAIITNNQYERNYWSLTNNLNYTLLYNPKLVQNEFAEKFTFSYSKGKQSAFTIYQYNHSLVRKIENNHLMGIGYGVRDSLFGFKVNLSYAILNEYIDYLDNSSKHNIRNSFRIKISRENKKVAFSSEYYYQPNIRSMNDYTLYGTTKLAFKIRESLAFSISDVYNYFNTSLTPVIHNFTIGVAYNYSTKEKEK
jgi:hypothetical protein